MNTGETALLICAAFGYGCLLGYYVGGREGAKNLRQAFRLTRRAREAFRKANYEKDGHVYYYSRNGIRDSDIVRSMEDVTDPNSSTCGQR